MNFGNAFFQRARDTNGLSASRLAAFGLASVMIVLSIVAVWGEFSTNRAAKAAKRFSELSVSFEQARFAVAAEESLNRKYRLQPSAEVLGRHQEAAAALLTALENARRLGEPADRALISDMLAIHKEYLLAIDRMFAAVDAGDITRANDLDRTDVDPKFDNIEARIFVASDAHGATAVQRLNELASIQTSVLAVTIFAFAIGMGLVFLFEFILRAQQRRAEEAMKHEAIVVRENEDRFRALMRAQYERFNAAINNMPLGFCMVDPEQRLLTANTRFGELYGLPSDMILPGTPLRTSLEYRAANGHFGDDIGPDFVERRLAAARKPEPWHVTRTTRDGRTISVLHQPLPGGGSLSTHEDITARREAEAQIAHMAHYDSLTDLPNRVLFREHLLKALESVDREKLAVLCIDLDRFKAVNDTLGHPVGDALLRAVGDRLQASARPTDLVARLGGDEFAIVQAGTAQPIGATALATRLIAEIAKPFELDGHQVIIDASVGISIAPNDGTDPDKLLKSADMALYRAKNDGRDSYRFFEPDMDARMQLRRKMELDLRRAFALGEFEVYYQPLITLKTEKISGFEALLRWHHPERGMVPPMEFIPIAEEIGLIGQIGAWVLKQACLEAATWPDDIHIAVNLSPAQFKHRAVVLDVVAALGASGLPAHRLEVEITETVLLQDTEATVGILDELHNLGVHISMDDFGTGYSSLAYLQKFPFDKIKIDRSFVKDVSESPQSIAIIRAVTAMSISLGMKTTAEGVETEEELKTLRQEGCTEVQGYLFSKPVPAAQAAQLLQSRQAMKGRRLAILGSRQAV
jgi:diguanylate cyclase (GGDEF)-like protein/PAS domain S-box-containing protein